MSSAYANAGVDYEKLDPFKRLAQNAARRTIIAAQNPDQGEETWSRGESAYLYRLSKLITMALVHEGLGTKALVADAVAQLTGKCHYRAIAIDTLATMFNDLATLGVPPKWATQYVSAGSDTWFENEERATEFVNGWADTCIEHGVIWTGGESPALKGVLMPEASEFCGVAIGMAHPLNILSPQYIQHGDAILLLPSNGIHANGLSLARKIAEKLKPQGGYATPLSNGRTFGETLLDPTPIYSGVVPKIQEQLDVDNRRSVHYAVNITGHGLRKIMRAPQNNEYILEIVPEPQEIFGFMQRHAEPQMTDEDAYGTLNMGNGFALFVNRHEANDAIRICTELGFPPCGMGHVRKSDTRRVVIHRAGKPDIVFGGETLNLR
jgi:phosphoribosylformylglycinamidine cyclo-ligase